MGRLFDEAIRAWLAAGPKPSIEREEQRRGACNTIRPNRGDDRIRVPSVPRTDARSSRSDRRKFMRRFRAVSGIGEVYRHSPGSILPTTIVNQPIVRCVDLQIDIQLESALTLSCAVIREAQIVKIGASSFVRDILVESIPDEPDNVLHVNRIEALVLPARMRFSDSPRALGRPVPSWRASTGTCRTSRKDHRDSVATLT